MSRVRNEPFDHATFSDYLSAIRDNAGIGNDAALSRASGVRASIISRWRRGEMRPSQENLNRIAAAVHIAPVALWIQAGIADHEDLDLGAQVDLSVWPKPFHDLHEVYERLNAVGQGDETLRAISRLVAGLKVDLEDLESQGHPSGGRRAG